MDFLLILGAILLTAGFILAGIEMVLPGFGIPGVLGALSLVGGVLLTADTVEEGLILTGIVLVVLVIMLAVIVLLLSKGKIHSNVILDESLSTEKGYISSNDLRYLLGKKGRADTDLKPSGRGDFEGVTFDITSEGKYIPKGKEIIITKVEGSKLIVKEI